MFNLLERYTETHEASCWRQFIPLCSVCRGIHPHEPQKETHKDSYCGESITLWSVWYHLNSYASKITYHCALCDIGFTFSHCMKKHMKLHTVENSYQCALCGKWFISWNNKQWHIKSHAGDNPYICALCNQDSSPETTYRDTWKVMLWIVCIHMPCVSRNSSSSTTQRDT